MSLVRELFSEVFQPDGSAPSISRAQLQTRKECPGSGKKDQQVIVKNPRQEDLTLCCPKSWSFFDAGVCWSNGVVEFMKSQTTSTRY
jgi:hypothetical protein